MPFRCPNCEDPRGLHILAHLDLPPDSRSDEIRLQLIRCRRCGLAAVGVYEESRRGALESESFSHLAHRVESSLWAEIRAALESCPAPGDPACRCPVHRRFGRHDALGRWCGLDELPAQGWFELVPFRGL